MKISPVTGPGAIKPNGTPEATRTAKAIEAFNRGASSYDKPAPTQGQAQETAVADPNNVSVEELSAIQPNTPSEGSNELVETPEEPTPTEPKAPTEDPALSRQFAQLARQEKAIRAQKVQLEQQIKVREDALAAREAALTAKDEEYKTQYIRKDALKSNLVDTLEAEGFQYDNVTQQYMDRQNVDPTTRNYLAKLEAKIASLEEANKTTQQTYQEQQQQQYQAAVKQIELDAKALIKSDPVTYEAISKTGTVKEVVKLIEETYAKDGQLLTVEEAAQEIENYLVEENYKMANSIDKIKTRLAKANASPKPVQKTPQTQQTQTPMKTLTNANSANAKQLSVRERAILAFKGELKS